MSDLRTVVANNISELRQKQGLTQLALAEILNYSDKAISKWERGESFPDVFMLKRLADLFGVSVDYLLSEDHSEAVHREAEVSKMVRRNRMLISFLATMLVWLIATVTFVTVGIALPDSPLPAWVHFLYAVPISAVVILIFNSIWGRRRLNYLIIAVITWTVLLSIHITILTLTQLNLWIIYIIGVPVQIIIFLWSGINYPKTKRNSRKKVRKNT